MFLTDYIQACQDQRCLVPVSPTHALRVAESEATPAPSASASASVALVRPQSTSTAASNSSLSLSLSSNLQKIQIKGRAAVDPYGLARGVYVCAGACPAHGAAGVCTDALRRTHHPRDRS